MPTPTKGHRLGGSPAHQRHMMANLATALFEHGKITTTEARARRLRPLAERLITFAKRGDLHARRQVLTVVTDKSVVHTLFAEIGPSFASRDGGYTRITKVGPRKGDNAALAVIELVREEAEQRTRRRRARRAPAAAAARSGRGAAAEVTATEAAEPAAVTAEEVEATGTDQIGDTEADAAVDAEAEVEAEADAEADAEGDESSAGEGRPPGTSRRPTNNQAAGIEPGRELPAGLDCAGPAAAGEPHRVAPAQLDVVRLRLDLRYDGSAFHGWATQPGQLTVQQTIEEALYRVLRLPEAPSLTVAGRTDAGVHARGQVAHTDVPAENWTSAAGPAERRLARLLPPSVRVAAIGPAPAGFDARYSALWRRYSYRVCDDPARADPLRRHDTLWYPGRLDLDRMNEAARACLGEHDFAAFCRSRPGATTIRELLRLDWARAEPG